MRRVDTLPHLLVKILDKMFGDWNQQNSIRTIAVYVRAMGVSEHLSTSSQGPTYSSHCMWTTCAARSRRQSALQFTRTRVPVLVLHCHTLDIKLWGNFRFKIVLTYYMSVMSSQKYAVSFPRVQCLACYWGRSGFQTRQFSWNFSLKEKSEQSHLFLWEELVAIS